MTGLLVVDTIVSDFFAENAFVAHLRGSDQCVVVDPGLDVPAIDRFLRERALQPAAILNTHGHGDHIAGNAGLKRLWPSCQIVIGRLEADKLLDPKANLSASFGGAIISPEADVLVDHGQILTLGDLELEVRHTPGHSRGHVVYLWKGAAPWVLFCGDVLFHGSIGRTDFPDGDMQTMLQSIHDQLLSLPDDTRVMPGHGPETTIGAERRFNPYLNL